MCSYTPVEFKRLNTVAMTFILSAKINHFIQQNICNYAPNCRIAFAKKTSFGSCTENQFWYQQFDLRQNRRFRGGQRSVHFDAAGICLFYFRTMKAMNFQEVITSILTENFKDHNLLAFELTSN